VPIGIGFALLAISAAGLWALQFNLAVKYGPFCSSFREYAVRGWRQRPMARSRAAFVGLTTLAYVALAVLTGSLGIEFAITLYIATLGLSYSGSWFGYQKNQPA
jgi:hypothetical protein